MSYCQANLNGWFDDLLQAGERIATGITRQSTPVGYGTYGGVSTPPMFPPTYGLPAPAPASSGMNLNSLLPYLVIGGVLFFILRNKK